MKIYIITGEKSGDKHASKIVHELKKLDNNIKFKAWGGNHLESEGVILDKHINEISYMGFWEVFMNIFKVIDNFNQCKKDILRFSPGEPYISPTNIVAYKAASQGILFFKAFTSLNFNWM